MINNNVITVIYLRRVEQRAARNQGIETLSSPGEMDWLEPNLSFPKEDTNNNNQRLQHCNFQDMSLCTATTKEQHDRAHEVSTQHSPRRSTTKTSYKPDCLKQNSASKNH